MPEKVMPGPVADCAGIREAVCVHTRKIMDACRDKDCVEDLRVYLTKSSQCALDRACNVKAGCAELLFVSENTVRTHSKRIYVKLGIHKRQELIELVESFGPEGR